VRARVVDVRSGASLSDWRASYAAGETRYIPRALAGVVTAALHVPPAPQAAMNARAAPDYQGGVAALRRDTGAEAATTLFERAASGDPDSAPLTRESPKPTG